MNLDQLRHLPTAVLSDALDWLSLPGSAHGLSPLRAGQRVCGPTFTIQYVPTDAEPGASVTSSTTCRAAR